MDQCDITSGTSSTPPRVVAARGPSPEVGTGPKRGAGGSTPQLVESLIMLVLLALVAWTCWLLYAPQIAAQVGTMVRAVSGQP